MNFRGGTIRIGLPAYTGAGGSMGKSVRITGICCLALALLALTPALVMRCIRPAGSIAVASYASGAALGFALAGITRSRKPGVIYLLLVVGAATVWPLYTGWPSVYTWDVLNYEGPVGHAITYLEALRPLVFILGVPYPYARFGWHSADPITETGTADE